jgi:hypothetical protein
VFLKICLQKICLSVNTYNRKTKKKKGRQEKKKCVLVQERREKVEGENGGKTKINRG